MNGSCEPLKSTVTQKKIPPRFSYHSTFDWYRRFSLAQYICFCLDTPRQSSPVRVFPVSWLEKIKAWTWNILQQDLVQSTWMQVQSFLTFETSVQVWIKSSKAWPTSWIPPRHRPSRTRTTLYVPFGILTSPCWVHIRPLVHIMVLCVICLFVVGTMRHLSLTVGTSWVVHIFARVAPLACVSSS